MSNQQGFPNVAGPFINPDGTPTQPFLQFLVSLWNRTGGAQGDTSSNLELLEVVLSARPSLGSLQAAPFPPPSPVQINDPSQAILAALAFGSANRASPTPTAIALAGLVLTASETIAAGALVNIWDNAGVANIRNANGGTTGKKAHGFVLFPATAGTAVQAYSAGQVISGLSGLTPGTIEYLGATPGATTETALTTSGQTSQEVGVALSASTMLFLPGTAIAL